MLPVEFILKNYLLIHLFSTPQMLKVQSIVREKKIKNTIFLVHEINNHARKIKQY